MPLPPMAPLAYDVAIGDGAIAAVTPDTPSSITNLRCKLVLPSLIHAELDLRRAVLRVGIADKNGEPCRRRVTALSVLHVVPEPVGSEVDADLAIVDMGVLGAAGQPQPGLRQAADAGQHPARPDTFAGGQRRQLGFEVGAGTQPNRDRAHAARLPPLSMLRVIIDGL